MGLPFNHHYSNKIRNIELLVIKTRDSCKRDNVWTHLEHFVSGWITSFEGIPSDIPHTFSEYQLAEMVKRSDELIDTIRRFIELMKEEND